MTLRIGLILLLAATAAGTAAAAPHKATGDAAAPLVPRDLSSLASFSDALLELHRGRPPGVSAALRRAGGRRLAWSPEVWRLPSRQARRLVPALATSGALREVVPDRPVRPAGHLAAGDPLVPRQWALGAVGADALEPPGPGKAVTVVDHGLDRAHPEFADRPGTTVLNPQTVTGEKEAHGTAVSSVIAAPANGLGMVGIYPRAALRSWDASRRRARLTTGELIAGIAAAARRSAGVINVSLGTTTRDPVLERTILSAVGRGSLVVAAAGNEFRAGLASPLFPANMFHVLTVASTDERDRSSGFSSRSPGIDLSAPGENIAVAVPAAVDPSGFNFARGTSYAAPLVAGAAAWIWTARPRLDNTQLFDLLRFSAEDLRPAGFDNDTGFGLLDLPHALRGRAPASDGREPNDDIDHVKRGGLLARPAPALTSSSKRRGSVAARLDSTEDPEDVYRVWVPAGRRLSVSLRANADVGLDVWRGDTPTVSVSDAARRTFLLAAARTRSAGHAQAVFSNRKSRGTYVYVDAYLFAGKPYTAAYTLRVNALAPVAPP